MSDHRTTAASYIASGGAVFFGLTANEFAAVVGTACAVLTFAVNAWIQWKHLELARQRIRAGDGVTGDD